MGDSPATFLECSPNFPSPSYLICNIHLYHIYHIHVYHPYFIYIKSHNGCCISSRIFENIPQNGPEFSHRILAIARFLVTAVRKNMGDLLSWLVSVSSSVPELTRHGLERASMSIPRGGGKDAAMLQKPDTVRQSCSGRLSALVMSALSLICQILLMFEANYHKRKFIHVMRRYFLIPFCLCILCTAFLQKLYCACASHGLA